MTLHVMPRGYCFLSSTWLRLFRSISKPILLLLINPIHKTIDVIINPYLLESGTKLK